jgi:hypothetical protein
VKQKEFDDRYVALVDPDRFDEIETGLTKITKLKHAATKTYNSWYNHFQHKLNLKSRPDIIEYIDEMSQDWKENTRRFHLVSLSHLMLALDKTKYRELVRLGLGSE